MLKNNWNKTLNRFDKWWAGKKGAILVVADLKRPAPVYSGLWELSDIKKAYKIQMEYLKTKAFGGDTVPDMSAYLGPGSLATFIGAEPIYTDKTIWYKDTCSSLQEAADNCIRFTKAAASGDYSSIPWYKWSIEATAFYASKSNGMYKTSMPDLEQNLDILSAVIGPQRLLIELMDYPAQVMETMELLYEVWKTSFQNHWELLVDKNGYSAFTHYNIIGKGRTSVLQSDISCMLSKETFDKFEAPFLRRQCIELDNIIYHLDGPGAIRHIDTILSIEKINAVQWVPGSGQPGNANRCWHELYDKITKAGKGLYVSLQPDEIDPFIEKYGTGRILIRTLAESCEEQQRLAEKYKWA